MRSYKKNLLIIGIFWDGKKFKTARQAPDQLAEALEKRGYSITRTSFHVNKFLRLIDTVFTILKGRNRYEIAIVPWFNGSGSFYWQEVATRLLKFFKKKVVLVVHGGNIPAQVVVHPAQYQATLKRADVIVAPSQFVADKLQHLGYNVQVIENLLDLEQYQFIGKETFNLNLLWMRTIEPLYNPMMALQVVKILKEKGYQPKLYVAGQQKDKELMNKMQEFTRTSRIDGEVEFTDYADHARKLELVRLCDFYLCTNKVDNAPVSLIEMMSLGLPVVSTNVGGIPYLVHDNINGMLVNDEDAKTMADKLEMIHLDPGMGKEMVRNAVQFSKQFDAEKVIAKWEIVFSQLSGHSSGSQHPF